MSGEKYTRDFVLFVSALKEDPRLSLTWNDIAGLFSVDGEPLDGHALAAVISRHNRGSTKYRGERVAKENAQIASLKARGLSDSAINTQMGYESHNLIAMRRLRQRKKSGS